VVLTSNQAASGGDLISQYFLDPVSSGDLGNGTESYIIGEVDGRLSGASGRGFHQPCNRGPSTRYNLNVAWNKEAYEVPLSNNGVYSDGTSLGSRHDAMKPQCAPTLRGDAEGCPLAANAEYTYKLLGLEPTPYARMPGDTRSTRPYHAVSSVPMTTDAESTLSVTSSAVHGFTTGDVITVTGANRLTPTPSYELLRNVEVTVVNSTMFTFEFTTTTRSTTATTPDGGGLNLNIILPPTTYVVHVETDAPHGLTNGDIRALSAVPYDLFTLESGDINGAQSVLVTGSDMFTINVTNSPTPIYWPMHILDQTEWRDGWLEQAIESVIDGENYELEDKLSVTSGSVTVTIDTVAAHGLSNGNEITLTNVAADVEGIPMDELNKQHIISGVTATTFNITVTTPATGTDGTTGGKFFVRHRAGAKKKRIEPRNVPSVLRHTPKIDGFVPRNNGMEYYGKDITCTPQMGPFTEIKDMEANYMIYYNNENDIIRTSDRYVYKNRTLPQTPPASAKGDDRLSSLRKSVAVITREIKNGGLCMHSEMGLVATSKCKALPFVVFAHGHQQTMPEHPIGSDIRPLQNVNKK
jgi:hypothetical protein